MRRHLIPAALLALTATAGPAAADATAKYHCEDGAVFVATFITSPGSADLAFADGRALALPQALSADGGRYATGDDEFWIKGESASLTLAGKSTTCTVID
jgi:membrane-bound inhibitor of C-type lysozyme